MMMVACECKKPKIQEVEAVYTGFGRCAKCGGLIGTKVK